MEICLKCSGTGRLLCDCDPDDSKACVGEPHPFTGRYIAPEHDCTVCKGTGKKQFKVTFGDLIRQRCK